MFITVKIRKYQYDKTLKSIMPFTYLYCKYISKKVKCDKSCFKQECIDMICKKLICGRFDGSCNIKYDIIPFKEFVIKPHHSSFYYENLSYKLDI